MRSRLKIIIMSLLLLSGLIQKNVMGQTKIVGGTNADIMEFPWQAFYISGTHMCGGTIIAKNWIVTAAHCTKEKNGSAVPVSQMTVKAGATNPYNSSEGSTYRVNQVIVHDNYSSSTLNYDIALLRLELYISDKNARPIKLINAENVAEGDTDPGVMAWVTGWGLTKVNPDIYATNLQKVQLPIVSESQASAVWGNIPATDLVAGYLNGTKDACFGDSGGPLVVNTSNGLKLAGIVSWGSETCNSYGGYTRISDMESWIRSKTGIVDYRPPVPAGDSIICQGTASSNYSLNPPSGTSAFDWLLSPSSAGTISGNSENITVSWNQNYTGSAQVKLRITVNNEVSEWSTRNITVAKNTKLLGQSVNAAICEAQPVSMNVSAEGNDLKYSWYKDDILQPSATADKLSYSSALPLNSGEYKCKISGLCGTAYSDAINLTVHPLTRITKMPENTTTGFDSDIILDVTSEGHNLTYQWEKGDQPLENSDSDQLLITGVNASDIGIYRVIVRGTCGTEISDSVYVYVKENAYSDESPVIIWPTVTNDVFHIAFEDDTYYTVRIISPTGVLVREMLNCQFKNEVDVGRLPRGLYIINISTRNLNKSFKLIKE